LEPEGNEFEIKTDSLGNIEFFLSSVKHRVPADIAAGCFDKSGVDGNIYTLLLESTQSLALEERMRIYSYASLAATGIIREQLKENSLFCVREMIKYGTVGDDFYNFTPVIKRKTYQINLPLRVNWCGTWTDAPPYCLENGGAVVNAAVKINDLLPVKVLIEKLDEPKVVLECFDYGCRKEFYDTDELSDCANPSDPFSLLKSALAVCGVVPMSGIKTEDNIFDMLNGGIFISTGVVGIPKGSGLGTSSILLAACVKGIFDFIGREVTDAEIFRRVLLAEQLMGTGGGWQDQAGGMTGGIKLISARQGYKQEINCEHLKAPQNFIDELTERFCLVYSGQRRLGRTILREMMDGYIQSNPLFVDVLKEIYSLAGEMKNHIESGNFDGFIDNLNRQTELTLTLNTGYTNKHLDKILDVCAEMTAGKMICGAGGGGFIQIVLKKGCSMQDLSTRLNMTFPHQGIDVWRCDFVKFITSGNRLDKNVDAPYIGGSNCNIL